MRSWCRPLASCLATVLVALPALAGRGVAVGDAAPPARLASADGATVDLAPAGRVSLLLFWATWSPRSLEALRYLATVPAKYPGERLALAAVNADHQRMDDQRSRDVAAALADTGYAGLSVIDPALDVFNAFGVIALPTFAIVGPGGRLEGFVAGFHFSAPEEIEEVLDRLIPREPVRKAGEPRPVPPEPVPRNGADVHLALAREALRMGRTEEAIASLSESVRRDPASVEAAVLLARVLRREGRGAEADAEAERIKGLQLAHPVEIAAAAGFLIDDGRAADAKETLDGAERLWPGDPALAALHLAARLAAGESPAEEEISAAVAIAASLPPDVASRLGLAMARHHPGEAAAILRATIERILAAPSR